MNKMTLVSFVLTLFGCHFSAMSAPETAPAGLENSCVSVLKEASGNGATYIDDKGDFRISDKSVAYAGMLVDTKKYRAPKIVEVKGHHGDPGSYMIIDNFMHNGEFRKAKIPLDNKAVAQVNLQSLPFDIIAGVTSSHIQMRFKMNESSPIQILDARSNEVVEDINDLIISYESALAEGGGYNPVLSTLNANPLVGRVMSGAQKLSETAEERPIEQYKLPINGNEISMLLNYYLNNTADIGMGLFYNTITANCTTSVFDGIDVLPKFSDRVREGSLDPFLTTLGVDSIVGPTMNALFDRFGEDVGQIQDMKDEYNGIIQEPVAIERVVKESPPFAPGGKTNPMGLVVSTRGTEKLTPAEKQVVDNMVDSIIRELPKTFDSLVASAVAIGGNVQSSTAVIQAVTEAINKKLSQRITNLQGQLPKSPVDIQVLFAPYPVQPGGESTDFEGSGCKSKNSLPCSSG